MFASQVLDFLFHLPFPVKLQRGVEVMHVYQEADVQEACSRFYKKYFSDQNKRTLLLGINPGRFGGGITGIPFTDPVHLESHCSISNNWKKQQELSSQFIYEMIAAFGGPAVFYKQFYISAVSPLGFVKGNKNLNYYDDPLLLKRIEPFVLDCLRTQLHFGINTRRCICIGEGANYQYLSRLNERYHFFETISALPHPRFILQYRRKQKQDYIQQYIDVLSQA